MRVPAALLLAALCAAPGAAELPAAPLCLNAPVPGFAPGQARLASAVPVGRAVELALRPAEGVAYPVPLARAPAAGTQGGVFPLDIRTAGTFRLLLSARAWIDLVRDGAGVPAAEHAHGAPCSGVAKIVAFRLEPGRYQLQLSEAEAHAIVVEVAPEALLPVADRAPPAGDAAPPR